MNKTITVSAVVKAPVEKIWKAWNTPEDITNWNFASDDWECPSTKIDLKVGGKFKIRMATKNGSEGFDFEGVYTKVEKNKLIEYIMTGEDARKVQTKFEKNSLGVKITETFEIENENSEEIQRAGWNAILENFRNYIERGS